MVDHGYFRRGIEAAERMVASTPVGGAVLPLVLALGGLAAYVVFST